VAPELAAIVMIITAISLRNLFMSVGALVMVDTKVTLFFRIGEMS
jgi:hypothetical protein